MSGIVEHAYRELGETLDTRPGISDSYERSVASKGRILDIGGRNSASPSAVRLRALGASEVVATDVVADHEPDLVDDITDTSIDPESFDGVWCVAVFEHVTDYWSAIDNVHRILRPGGEAFVYVPFCFKFHDQMDYHRFTITELARMMRRFSDTKVFVPSTNGHESGYGWVLLDVLSFGLIQRTPQLHHKLARVVNRLLGAAVRLACAFRRRDYTTQQAVFFATYLSYNHGFCAWVRK
jgi:SAM-dependent methyltransferase